MCGCSLIGLSVLWKCSQWKICALVEVSGRAGWGEGEVRAAVMFQSPQPLVMPLINFTGVC